MQDMTRAANRAPMTGERPAVPGALVTLNGHDTPLVIETVEHTAFGPQAHLCGFQSDDHLVTDEVALGQLDLYAAPGDAPQVDRGTEVRLRPAGPVMTVIALEDDDTALCEWDGAGGIVRQRSFPIAGLTLSLLENF